MRPENPTLDLNSFSSLNPRQKIEHLIRFALLAPSSHNTQPWLFSLVDDDEIKVYANHSRALGYSDATGRELYISLGAAIENIITAAKYFGYSFDLRIGGAEQDLAATIRLTPGSANPYGRATAQAVLDRHNNRFPFEERSPQADFMAWIKYLSGTEGIEIFNVYDAEKKKQITEVVGKGLQVALDDPKFREELSHWVKPSFNKYADGMPGYNLDMPFLVSLFFPAVVRNFKLGNVQRKAETKSLNKTPVFVILATDGESPEQWLKTGMIYERIAIAATEHGLKTGVLAAAIEIGDFYKELQQILNTNKRPQMFFRLGYTKKIPKASPRLNLEQVLKK